MVLSGMQREMGGFLGKMKGVAGAVWSSDHPVRTGVMDDIIKD